MALDVIARIILLPVLAAQGLWVRHKAVFLPEPPGDRQGQIGSGPDLRLLVIGDSSAAGVGVGRQVDSVVGHLVKRLSKQISVQWALHAETGETTKSALEKLKGRVPQSYDLAVVVLGVNDVTHAATLRAYVQRHLDISEHLKSHFGVRHVILSGLPPLGEFTLLPQPLRWVVGKQADRFDGGLAKLAQCNQDISHLKLSLPYDPEMVAPDGYHPAPEAHAYWAELLADHINALPKDTLVTGES